MQVRLATEEVIPAWLALVREVEPLFGPMPNFETTLKRNIARATALCAMNGDLFCGGLLVRPPSLSKIGWLAVPAAQRGRGAGDALVRAAIAHYAHSWPIDIVTFRDDEPGGAAARRLYEKHGFIAGALIMADGMPRQRFTLTRR